MKTMKGVAILAACVLLSASAPHCRATAHAEAPRTPGAEACGTCGQKGRDDPDDFVIETRTGEAVALRARQLRGKNKGVARAMRDLERRSLRPAFEQGVSLLAVSRSGSFRKASAQDSAIVEPDVEITFLTYDDGDQSNWEGLIYYRSAEVESTDYAVIDISTGDPYTTYEQNYSYERHTQLRDYVGRLGGRAGRIEAVPAAYRPGSAALAGAQDPPKSGPRIFQFISCAREACFGAATRCMNPNPATWINCFVNTCYAALINCARQHLGSRVSL